MSKEAPTSLTFALKILGIIIALVGLILTYYTYTSLNAAGIAATFSIVAGVALIILGLIILIAKPR